MWNPITERKKGSHEKWDILNRYGNLYDSGSLAYTRCLHFNNTALPLKSHFETTELPSMEFLKFYATVTGTPNGEPFINLF